MVVRSVTAFALLAAVAAPAGAATFTGTSPYASAADSPFAALDTAPGGYAYLQTFEAGASAVGVTNNGMFLGPNTTTDSVDADDGSIDGSGAGGGSLYSGGASTLSFAFDATVLGQLPTHAGIAWTDVGFSDEGLGFGTVTFEAFDGLGVSLGTLSAFLGDGAFAGQTAEDRFFGVTNAGGIGRITLAMAGSTDWEADHLAYGVLTPIPAALPLLAGALGALGWARRRGQRRA